MYLSSVSYATRSKIGEDGFRMFLSDSPMQATENLRPLCPKQVSLNSQSTKGSSAFPTCPFRLLSSMVPLGQITIATNIITYAAHWGWKNGKGNCIPPIEEMEARTVKKPER